MHQVQDCVFRLPLALRPVTHLHENIPFPIRPPVSEQDNDCSSAESIDYSKTSKSFAGIVLMLSDEEPHSSQAADVSQLLNQNNLNDLVRDLGLPEKNWSSYFPV